MKHLGSERLILTGLSTNSCVLFTASDAYMRDLELHVPPDGAVAACSYREHDMALEEMRDMLKADLTPSDSIDFEDSWLDGTARAPSQRITQDTGTTPLARNNLLRLPITVLAVSAMPEPVGSSTILWYRSYPSFWRYCDLV